MSGVRSKTVGDILQREADARFVRDGRDVQRCVRGASRRRHRRARILETLACDEIARQRAATIERRHHPFTGAAGDSEALAVHGGDHRGAERRQAERLTHHRHGVGGELSGARADRRRARTLERTQLFARHCAGLHTADAFDDVEDRAVRPAGFATRQHRAAVDEDRRHVEAASSPSSSREGFCRSPRSRRARRSRARARPSRHCPR